MVFVAIGTVLVLLKLLEIGPVAEWSWWGILLPFGLAVAWWAYSDSTGLTTQRAMRRMDERKQARRERDMQALGLNVHSDRRKRAMRQAADAAKQRSAGSGSGGAPPKDE